MKMDATIFNGFGNAGKPKKASVELFELAKGLSAILDQQGLVKELKQTSLHGSIKVRKKDLYSRYDFAALSYTFTG